MAGTGTLGEHVAEVPLVRVKESSLRSERRSNQKKEEKERARCLSLCQGRDREELGALEELGSC